jgi:hypothetical protein
MTIYYVTNRRGVVIPSTATEDLSEAKSIADDLRKLAVREHRAGHHYSVMKAEQVYTTSTIDDALAEAEEAGK